MYLFVTQFNLDHSKVGFVLKLKEKKTLTVGDRISHLIKFRLLSDLVARSVLNEFTFTLVSFLHHKLTAAKGYNIIIKSL